MSALNKTPNILYNIINFEEPNVVFLYGVLMIIFIILFSILSINYSIIIGLLFYSILIYYFYTDRNLNNVYASQKFNDKFETLQRPTNIYKDYPDIVDFIFYMQDMRKYSFSLYDQITSLFREFCILYQSCNKDYNLIDNLYLRMIDIKIEIMNKINAYIYNLDGYQFTQKIFKCKQEAEQILNKYLDELILIKKKKIYYNGYNIKSKILDTTGVLPYNIVSNSNPEFNNIKIPKMSDLIVF